jgi:hypothetical protein
MSTFLKKARESSSGTVTLEGEELYEHERGVEVGLKLLPLRKSFATGALPMPAVEKILEQRPELVDNPAAVAKAMAEESDDPDWLQPLQVHLAACVTSLDGEPASLTPDDVLEFSDAAFFQLVPYVMRKKELPGKGNGSAGPAVSETSA